MIRVVIPFGGSCRYRLRSLGWLQDHLPRMLPDASLHVGVCDGEWSKAVAVADAVDSSWADDDVLVVHDADVWAPKLPNVVAVVEQRRRQWATPHTLVARLTEEQSAQVMAGTVPFSGVGTSRLEQPPYQGVVGGGCVVLPVGAYRTVPLDPRFRGWGQEDESWGFALRCLLGQPHRAPDPLYHLWHPHPPRRSRSVGNRDGERLRNRYRAAQGRRCDMEAVLDEVRGGISASQ